MKFVIVSAPRTGSTHLVDYLGAVDGVCCLSEIFHADEVLLRHKRKLDAALMEIATRDADPLGWLKRVEETYGDYRCFGFKLFPSHDSALLKYLCAKSEWRKIYLWRDNLLDQYLSFLVASARFGSKEWGRVPDSAPLQVMADLAVEDLHRIEQNYIAIENALSLADRDDVFGLEYEDLGRPAIMRDLLQFLDVSADAIDQQLARTQAQFRFERGPTGIDRIKNYDELRDVLRRTRFRRFLPEYTKHPES